MSMFNLAIFNNSSNINVNNNVGAESVSTNDVSNIFGDANVAQSTEQNVISQELEELGQSKTPLEFLRNLLSSENIMNKLAEGIANTTSNETKNDIEDSDTETVTEPSITCDESNVQEEAVQEEAVSEEENSPKADVNGKIDATKQGNYGDCWLLSGVNSLTTSENGKKIIDDMITENKDGTYTVNLDGVDKSYTYSADEINEAQKSNNYSSGDGDMVALEMAVQECRDNAVSGKDSDLSTYANFVKKVNNVSSDKNSLNYGGTCQEFYELAGLDSKIYTSNSSGFEQNYNNVLDKIENNSESYSATMTFTQGDKLTDINGNKVSMTGGDSAHVWSVNSVDGDNVTMVNPWDSSKTSTFVRDELLKNIADISYAQTSS